MAVGRKTAPAFPALPPSVAVASLLALEDMRIAASHPALPGHFPGHPVVPGVVLLEAVAAALPQHAGTAMRVTGFPVVKFLAPLLPEHEFEIVFSAKRAGQMAFEIVANGETLASGTLACEGVHAAA
jgi:3-hydroxymyristoyl/3-hydroxydecanoyl-(acyl carrier protein) dehydratase